MPTACGGTGIAIAVLLAFGPPPADAQGTRFPANDVRVEIAVGSNASATVRESYAITRELRGGLASFQYLASPCASIDSLSASIGGRPVAFATERNGPWVMLHDTTADVESVGGNTYQLQYVVHLDEREPAIPIVLPAAVLDRSDGKRGAAVLVRVRFSPPAAGARVLVPQLLPEPPGDAWSGTLLALPSLVRVRVPAIAAAAGCSRSLAGNEGGLTWRFAIFVAVMALWVPLYLWWVARRPDSEA